MKKALVISAAMLITALIIWGACSIIPHANSAQLCDLIYQGNTKEAIEKINRTKNVNCYTAPLWSRRFYNAVETDIDLPLVAACEMGNYEVVKALLNKGADPNMYLESGWSPIEVLFVRNHKNRIDIAKELIAHGVDVDGYGSHESALFVELQRLLHSQNLSEDDLAIITESISLLIEEGASLADSRSNSIMHYLAASGDVVLLERLAVAHANLINQANTKGETPLMWAASHNSAEGVAYLLENGAEITLKNAENKTAYDYAIEQGYTDLAKLIKP